MHVINAEILYYNSFYFQESLPHPNYYSILHYSSTAWHSLNWYPGEQLIVLFIRYLYLNYITSPRIVHGQQVAICHFVKKIMFILVKETRFYAYL